MPVSQDFLLSVYERCNEHIKEQSTKRDQTIAFYLVVLSFYFGSYSSVKGLLVSSWSLLFFNLVMIVISGLSIRTLSGLRSWHMQYSYSAFVMSKVIANNIYDISDIRKYIFDFFIMNNNKHKDMPLSFYFKGVENRVIVGLTLISGFPAVMFSKELCGLLGCNLWQTLLGEVVVYSLYVSYYLINCMKLIKSSSNKVTWVVDFE